MSAPDPIAAPVLEVRDVSVTYRVAETPSLVDVSLRVEPGQVVLVAGPSGCGKSTLLRVLNGLVPRSYRAEVTGSVLVDGEDATDLALKDISASVGTLLQDPAKQVVGHSVLAEIAFGLENRGVDPHEIERRARAVAERLHLTHLLEAAPAELSGGQLQLVAFAGILVLEPRVVLVDEPLANLDPDAASTLLRALRRYVDEGGAAVIVEHRVDEALALEPDAVLALDAGRTLYSGDVDGFLAVASPTEVKLPFDALIASDRLDEMPETRRSAPLPVPRSVGAPARLQYDGATLGYGGARVLTDVTRTFAAGERVAVLGRNGAGKSTLLRAAVGLVAPSAGSVLLDGRPAASLRARDLVAVCGYLFQNPAQALFSSTVRAELAFGPKNLGLGEPEVERRSWEALSAVALDEVPGILDRPPRTLSHGQQRRLAVALALTLRPTTLILDEPSAGQDLRSTTHFLDAIAEVPGVDSVYFITHDVDLALERADRVLVVDGGGIVADTTPAGLVHDRALWHLGDEAATGSAGERGGGERHDAVLRETDYVRAARAHVAADEALPPVLELARRLRATRDRTTAPSQHRSTAPIHPDPLRTT